MLADERLQTIRQLITAYVRSPSLRHIRDPRFVDELARRIMQAVDLEPSVWRK